MMNARVLARQLADLLRREQAAMAEFLVALSNFHRQRSWVDLGYASLFDFLHRELGLSLGAAHYRKTAAELMQKFPEIIEPLRDGRLCITSIVQLAKVLTAENCRDVLPRFFQLSKRDAMAVAAELQPATAAPHRDIVTALRATAPPLTIPIAATPKSTSHSEAVLPLQPVETHTSTSESLPGPLSNVTQAPSTSPMPTPFARDFSEPLTGNLSRLHITVPSEFIETLEAVRNALAHGRTRPSMQTALKAGLDLVLKQHARRKGLVEKPRKIARPAKSDTLTAKDKREVWTRDGGRCQWPLESGGICGSTVGIEFDHFPIPRARGGPSTAKNLRLLCRMHNDLAARQAFGDQWMDQFTRNPRKDAAPRPTTGLPAG